VLSNIVNNSKIKDNEYVAVFEDDVAFPEVDIFHNTFKEGIKNLKNFKFLYLGANFPHYNVDKFPPVGKVINSQIFELENHNVTCAHGVIYRKSILKDIVSTYKKHLLNYYILPAHFRKPSYTPIATLEEMYDTFLPLYLYENKIPIYIFYPPLAIQESLTGSYDFIGFHGNVPCKMIDKATEKITDFEKLKDYDEVWTTN